QREKRSMNSGAVSMVSTVLCGLVELSSADVGVLPSSTAESRVAQRWFSSVVAFCALAEKVMSAIAIALVHDTLFMAVFAFCGPSLCYGPRELRPALHCACLARCFVDSLV